MECFTKKKTNKRNELGLLKACLILRIMLLTDAFERGSSVVLPITACILKILGEALLTFSQILWCSEVYKKGITK